MIYGGKNYLRSEHPSGHIYDSLVAKREWQIGLAFKLDTLFLDQRGEPRPFCLFVQCVGRAEGERAREDS